MSMQKRSYKKRCQKDARWIVISIVMTFVALIATLSLALGDNAYKIISSSDVIEKIENGDPVNYDHVVIHGRLDFAQLNLSENENGRKIIKSPISITDSIVDDNLVFCYIIFDNAVDFDNTSFMEACDFSSSIFGERANFTLAKFYENVSFVYTHFIGDAFFLSTIFSKDANFWETIFVEDVDFGSARFNRNAIFNFSTFRGDGYFNNAVFYKNLFLDCTFQVSPPFIIFNLSHYSYLHPKALEYIK